jgi:hypothetical protein
MFNGNANICKFSFLELISNNKKIYLTADNSTTPVHKQLAIKVICRKECIIRQAYLAYLPAFDSQQQFQPSPTVFFFKKANKKRKKGNNKAIKTFRIIPLPCKCILNLIVKTTKNNQVIK